MRLSVIVCAYTLDRWTSLQEAIASCSNQTRQPDEVIVVIDYNDELLHLAHDLGVRLLTAFDNKRTNIPHPRVI